ncbi:hypothetical protein QUF64_09985 [Anaerolineales bacterium HSG6]|nr:hypothetical protein [Anaerolineales bacterium HSG6]
MEPSNSNKFFSWLDSLPWSILVMGSLTLGLAPFVPPHLIEKLGMLFQGELSRPIDIFDLFMHGMFPALLLLKAGYTAIKKREK